MASGTDVGKQDLLGAYDGSTLNITWDDADDSATDNIFTLTGGEILLVRNTADTGSSSYDIYSVDDPYGRQEDIENVTIDAGEVHAYGPAERKGWQDDDGHLHFSADSTDVEFAVLDSTQL